ncbi:hypothetical protein F4818DRAFT_345505 [Hypoxylon cercidicola]|nr:hypothetical protein F4818DRAFT_345505 [Hypoxylon cercidicola]
MGDDFDDLFSKYPQPKNRRETGAASSREVASSNSRFEDITQETGFLGIVFQVYLTAETPQQQNRQETRFKDYSLILRRIVPQKQGDRDPVLQLEIQSKTLREAFKELAAGRVNINLRRSPIIITEPYVEIYHCQEQIEEAIKNADDGMKDELRLLQTFRKDYMYEAIDDFESLETIGLISFDFLQHLFAPGSLVVLPSRFMSASQPHWAAVVVQCQVFKNKNDKEWEINLAYTNFDGASFGTVFTKLRFPAFNDIKKIINLPVYPIKYHPDPESILRALEKRGRNYHRLCMDPELGRQGVSTGSHCYYEGSFWEVNSSRQDADKTQQDTANSQREPKKSRGICGETTPSLEAFCNPPSSQCKSRVVIDLPGFVEENPSFRDYVRHDNSGPSVVLSRSGNKSHSESHVNRLQLLTMPSFIPAFSLAKRSWGFIDVDGISDIQWDTNAYENLQMDLKRKESVRRLVSTHRTSSSGFDDFISGKGKGLVFLLHGPPGSGKTMTAETVAESLHSPLYYTSGGELSIDKDRIEEQLRLIFQRIHRWGAILLLDEADTFMARRGEDSLERNALVSILLRMLEYQSGILFLTTNRLSDFDTAFYSRIHVRIEFESPDAQRRMYIWSKIVGKLDHEISQSEFERLGSLPLDGRRIKNVVKVASLLMQSKGDDAQLSFEDVKAALKISAGDPSEDEVQRMIEELCI